MRPSIDEYFLGFAKQAAMRATCLRKKVGAVIARDGILLSTGYNGSIRGMPHCDDPGVGCLMEANHCVRTVHAESNAILQAAKNGVAIDGATLYSTASPCWPCFGLVANSGIKRIVFGEAYRAEDPGPKRVIEVAKKAGIELVSFATSQVTTEQLAAEAARLADPTNCRIGAAAKRVGLDLSDENPVLSLGDRMIKAGVAGSLSAEAQQRLVDAFACDHCGGSAAYKCVCARCERERAAGDEAECYHTCVADQYRVTENHEHVRGRAPQWVQA